ncbi:hypothetical protein [Kitasatospora purpeofusca]|uniref:hypothetical protein n=1 Tax=Kitasatospora purpeofusca TaxID=67352 RepID=UPI0036D366C0
MSDAGWVIVSDALPVPGRLGDAVRCLVAGGLTRRAIPADFPAGTASVPSSAAPPLRHKIAEVRPAPGTVHAAVPWFGADAEVCGRVFGQVGGAARYLGSFPDPSACADTVEQQRTAHAPRS